MSKESESPGSRPTRLRLNVARLKTNIAVGFFTCILTNLRDVLKGSALGLARLYGSSVRVPKPQPFIEAPKRENPRIIANPCEKP